MAWLRLDDGFADHPKVLALGSPEWRWGWLEVLLYCARYRTNGRFSDEVSREIVHVFDDFRQEKRRLSGIESFLNRAVSVGLLERVDGGYQVHDWADYQPKDPTAAERQARRRALLGRDEDRDGNRDETVTSRAREPVLRPEVAKATSGERARDDLWEALVAELGEPRTKSERGRYNAALKELRDIHALPLDIHARCRSYRRKWPDIALTPQALTGNWTQLEPVRQPEPIPVEEVVDMPEISEEERAANLERARLLRESLEKGVVA